MTRTPTTNACADRPKSAYEQLLDKQEAQRRGLTAPAAITFPGNEISQARIAPKEAGLGPNKQAKSSRLQGVSASMESQVTHLLQLAGVATASAAASEEAGITPRNHIQLHSEPQQQASVKLDPQAARAAPDKTPASRVASANGIAMHGNNSSLHEGRLHQSTRPITPIRWQQQPEKQQNVPVATTSSQKPPLAPIPGHKGQPSSALTFEAAPRATQHSPIAQQPPTALPAIPTPAVLQAAHSALAQAADKAEKAAWKLVHAARGSPSQPNRHHQTTTGPASAATSPLTSIHASQGHTNSQKGSTAGSTSAGFQRGSQQSPVNASAHDVAAGKAAGHSARSGEAPIAPIPAAGAQKEPTGHRNAGLADGKGSGHSSNPQSQSQSTHGKLSPSQAPVQTRFTLPTAKAAAKQQQPLGLAAHQDDTKQARHAVEPSTKPLPEHQQMKDVKNSATGVHIHSGPGTRKPSTAETAKPSQGNEKIGPSQLWWTTEESKLASRTDTVKGLPVKTTISFAEWESAVSGAPQTDSTSKDAQSAAWPLQAASTALASEASPDPKAAQTDPNPRGDPVASHLYCRSVCTCVRAVCRNTLRHNNKHSVAARYSSWLLALVWRYDLAILISCAKYVRMSQ